MEQEKLNMSVRRFLKEVGVSSQHELEKLARSAVAGSGKTLKVKMVLTAKGTPLQHAVEGELDLSDAQCG